MFQEVKKVREGGGGLVTNEKERSGKWENNERARKGSEKVKVNRKR